MSILPDNITVEDLTSGKVSIDEVLKEVTFLQQEISGLKHEMVLFVRSLATIQDESSQRVFYQDTTIKAKALQDHIDEYSKRYNKLVPVVNFAQSKYGIEPEMIPQKQSMGTKPSPLSKEMAQTGPDDLQMLNMNPGGSPNQPILL